MNIKEFQHYFTDELSAFYPNTEIQSFLSIVLEEYLGFQRIDLVTKSDVEISLEKLEKLKEVIARLKNQEPVQYITGSTEFYGLPFIVDKNVLIPRPETEELVEWMVSEVAKVQSFKDSKAQSDKVAKSSESVISSEVEKSLSILDIGTGSGCIPIALKKNLSNTIVSAIDVSKGALEVAQRNAELNGVEVQFIEENILTTQELNQQYDIIVSNPPYVRELEKVEIKDNVLQNEPHLALFVEDHDPLIFYRKIAELAKTHLNDDGMLFFEINQYLGKEMLELLRLLGFENVMLKKDLFGNDRMIKASLCK